MGSQSSDSVRERSDVAKRAKRKQQTGASDRIGEEEETA